MRHRHIYPWHERVRRWWLQRRYTSALSRVLIREQIATFPGCGMAYRHPILKRQSPAHLWQQATALRGRLNAEHIWMGLRSAALLREIGAVRRFRDARPCQAGGA